jgi:putative FmdB family regulatory protein
MPTYEYECGACGHHFEEFQSMSAEPIKTCPECKKRKVRRLLGTGGALIFKGSGFYATDYRSSSYKADAKKDTPATPSACDGCKKDSGTCPKKAKD